VDAQKALFNLAFATIFPAQWAMAALGSSVGLHADVVGGRQLFGSD
jgi:hypothetical protein